MMAFFSLIDRHGGDGGSDVVDTVLMAMSVAVGYSGGLTTL